MVATGGTLWSKLMSVGCMNLINDPVAKLLVAGGGEKQVLVFRTSEAMGQPVNGEEGRARAAQSAMLTLLQHSTPTLSSIPIITYRLVINPYRTLHDAGQTFG